MCVEKHQHNVKNFICIPLQVCHYFPLRSQLSKLLTIPSYRELLMHEYKRKSKARVCFTDVYDSPRWQEKIGPQTATLKRIVVHSCVDGMPAHNRKECGSVKPIQHLILSLPPWLRYKAEHMLIQMLIPASLKRKGARKYYDFAAFYEINDLYRHGVDGVRVLQFGMTLDTPGRRELLDMQAVQAHFPCPHCLHTWQPGLRGQVYGGYRRFLSLTSPWRAKQFVFMDGTYMYRDVEKRDAPVLRTDRNVAVMVAQARPDRPYCGHKGNYFLLVRTNFVAHYE